MGMEKIARERAYELADAENVLAQTKTHFSKMEPLGATLARVRAYEGTIAEARKFERSGGRVSLDDARRELKDHFGRYRKRADIAANAFEGANEKLARSLRCDGAFPKTDAKLAAAVEEIDAVLKAHAHLLARVAFGAKEQQALIKAAQRFIAERTAKPTKVGKQKAESTQRDRVYDTLRYQTSWFRRVGLEALEGDSAASGFHRVTTGPKRSPKAQPGPAPAQKQA